MNFTGRICVLTLFVFVGSIASIRAQETLFDNEEAVGYVTKGAYHMYSMHSDSTLYYAEKVREILPNHPVIPMMEGLLILWENIPVLEDNEFDRFREKMRMVIESSTKYIDREHPESVFFEMSARGILAEYYADRGQYMNAVGEATQAYGLLRRGFDLQKELEEFEFIIGIYNYFRVAYPAKYPIIKPFIWFFRDGDKELGLQQIKNASQNSVISYVEATIYLSYIYLRYEEKPEAAQKYVKRLADEYPHNLYIKTKYLESLNIPGYFDQMPQEEMQTLLKSNRLYYELVGNVFLGIYHEKVLKDSEEAFRYYTQAIGLGEAIKKFAEHYKSMAYLGAGRLSHQKGNRETAREFLKLAVDFSETNEVKEEAQDLLNDI